MATTTEAVPRLKARDRNSCEICKGDDQGPSGRSLAELEAAVEAGCPLCSIVWYATSTYLEASFKWHSIDSTYDSIKAETTVQTRHSIVTPVIRDFDGLEDVEVFTLRGQQPCSLPFVKERTNRFVPRRQRYLGLLQRWLDECCNGHPECNLNVTPLPTRVIDVGDGEDDIVKLYISQGENAKYIALSHCWW